MTDTYVGQSKARKTLLNRTFAGLPLEDAKAEMYVVVTPADIRKAQRQDPEHCVFAEACRRSMQAKSVVFLRTHAYVDVPTGAGERKVLRFSLPPATRKFIADYDSEGVTDVSTFTLKPPLKSDRLGKRRANKGPGSHSKPAGKNADTLTLNGVRLGSGQYRHFARG